MTRFVARRFLQSLLTLFILAAILFALARAAGNPVDLLLPQDVTEAERQDMIEHLGLDRPYPVQFAEFLAGTLQGDLGTSFKFRRPVAEMYFERLPNSLSLMAATLLIAMLVGFPLGVLAGTNRGKPADGFASAFAVIGIAAPSFWVGLVLIEIFAVQLRILPVARIGGIESYVLPAVTLALGVVAAIVRLLRSGMIDALDSEYVKLARIKGVSQRKVIWKHCLRNALIPVVTVLGSFVGVLIGGTIVIESVFAWPGVGRLAFEGIQARDYPLVQGIALLHGAMIIFMNLLVDISYAYIDPRIRYG